MDDGGLLTLLLIPESQGGLGPETDIATLPDTKGCMWFAWSFLALNIIFAGLIIWH